jgi:purine-cytosine permease-like protein
MSSTLFWPALRFQKIVSCVLYQFVSRHFLLAIFLFSYLTSEPSQNCVAAEKSGLAHSAAAFDSLFAFTICLPRSFATVQATLLLFARLERSRTQTFCTCGSWTHLLKDQSV